MRAAMAQLNLSARAYHRTQSVKLARTIADLAGSEEIQSVHLAEALHLRQTEVDVGVGGVVIIYSAESPGREEHSTSPIYQSPIYQFPISQSQITQSLTQQDVFAHKMGS